MSIIDSTMGLEHQRDEACPEGCHVGPSQMPSGHPVMPLLSFASAIASLSKKAAWRPDFPGVQPNCRGWFVSEIAALWCVK